MSSRIIYMGTPDFAVPALDALAQIEDVDISLVVTQPDRPAGRGRKLTPPAVKVAAERLDLPVVQTQTLRDPDVRRRILDIKPDVIVVAAFGMILGKWILELPRCGCVNLHASLLPGYRGANPIAAAIAMGEVETGVTLMRMDRGLDTGDVYARARIDIQPYDTTESLTPRLATVAGQILVENLSGLLSGSLQAVPQGSGATVTRLMTKDDGWLDFNQPAVELERRVRAMWPWPRAWTTQNAARIQVHRVSVGPHVSADRGQIVHEENRVLVATTDGSLELLRVQLPGGRPVEGSALRQLTALADGNILGETGRPDGMRPLVTPA
jgi:methionyl-tRNA formyltransferase